MLDSVSLDIDFAHRIDDPPSANAAWLQALHEAGLGQTQRSGGSVAAEPQSANPPRIVLAQVEEPPPEEDPAESEFERGDPTDEQLREAELSPDPAVRWRAYEAAKRELAKVDPQSPNAGADVSAPGWAPSGRDIEHIRSDLTDASTARALGLTSEQYRDLARDPAQGGRISAGSKQERDAAIMAWKTGQIKGPPARSPNPEADIRDADGKDWDVKSFNSRYENGFRLPQSANVVDNKLNKGQSVIVNTENMSEADIATLKAEGARRGWGDRVIYLSANPFRSSLQMPEVP